MKKGEIILCACCRNTRKQFLDDLLLCQICYRAYLRDYSYYEWAVPKEYMSKNQVRICELLIENRVDRKEIAKILGLNDTYVQQVIKKYTYRCDKNGKMRPF